MEDEMKRGGELDKEALWMWYDMITCQLFGIISYRYSIVAADSLQLEISQEKASYVDGARTISNLENFRLINISLHTSFSFFSDPCERFENGSCVSLILNGDVVDFNIG